MKKHRFLGFVLFSLSFSSFMAHQVEAAESGELVQPPADEATVTISPSVQPVAEQAETQADSQPTSSSSQHGQTVEPQTATYETPTTETSLDAQAEGEEKMGTSAAKETPSSPLTASEQAEAAPAKSPDPEPVGQTRARLASRPSPQPYAKRKKAVYDATIIHEGYSIDTLPWGAEGFQSSGVGSSSQFLQESVKVINECQDGYYAEITSLTNDYLGWVDKRSFNRKPVKTYQAMILYPNYTIDSLPWGEPGSKQISSTKYYVNQKVDVVLENADGLYALALFQGSSLGWIDKRALTDDYLPLTQPYVALVYKGGYSIDSKPWGNKGFQSIGSTDHLFGQRVIVTGLNRTQLYAFVQVDGQNYGWIDQRALLKAPFTGVNGQIIRSHYDIATKPWGEPYYRIVGQTSASNLYRPVQILAWNPGRTYAFVSSSNQVLGWIDHRALSKPSGHWQKVVSPIYSLDSKPWGVAGFSTLAYASQIVGQSVEILGESENGAYALIRRPDQSLAWLDKRAFHSTSIRLNVPLISQRPTLPTGCEITSVAMMLRYLGLGPSAESLAKEMPYHWSNPNLGYVGNPFLRSGWTIYPPALVNLVKKYAGSAQNLTQVTTSVLEDQLRQNKPVVAWVTLHGFTVHAITLTGFDEQAFYYNDPWTAQKDVRISKSHFTNLWQRQARRALSI